MDVWTRQHGFLLSVAFGALGLIGLDTTSRSSPLLATSIFPSVTPMAGRGPAVSYAVAVAFSVAAAVAASRTAPGATLGNVRVARRGLDLEVV